jgi:hypothetical protein
MLQKLQCTWTVPLEIAGAKVKTSVDISTGDMQGMKIKNEGYNVGTMDTGGKFTVSYSGVTTTAKDNSAGFAGKWMFTGGTGKLKGIKGGGTYKGTGKADGSGTVLVEGDYTLP